MWELGIESRHSDVGYLWLGLMPILSASASFCSVLFLSWGDVGGSGGSGTQHSVQSTLEVQRFSAFFKVLCLVGVFPLDSEPVMSTSQSGHHCFCFLLSPQRAGKDLTLVALEI